MFLYFLAVTIIVFGGGLAMMFRKRLIPMKVAGVFAVSAGCLTGLIHSACRLFDPEPNAGASFEYLNTLLLTFDIDGLSAFFLVIIFAVSMLSALYSFHCPGRPEEALKTAVGYLFFSLLVASMALVVTAKDMIAFMLSWEIMSLSSFFLVVYRYRSPGNRGAGYLYFVFSHVGAMVLLAAFGIMYHYTGSFDFTAASALPDSAKIIVFIVLFIGFGSKAGVFPFHVWLPHAHSAVPSHISAVMSGVMIKIGIYGIVRMYFVLGLHTPLLGGIVIVAGMVTGITGIVYALGRQDLKRLLAYSSVENTGVILIGIGIGMVGLSSGHPGMALLGFSGGLLHVLNHSIFKSLLFMAAGIVIQKTGIRSIDALGGLLKKMKVTGTAFLMGSLAISGLPPFNGFVGEFFIYVAGFQGGGLGRAAFTLSHLAVISLAVIGGLTLACFTRVMGVVFLGEPRNGFADDLNERGPMMLGPMVVLSAACVLMGVFPKFFIVMASRAVLSLGTVRGEMPLDAFVTMGGGITFGALVFLGVFLGIFILRICLYRGKTIGRGATWGCGFALPTSRMQYTGASYAASIIDFFKPVAPAVEDHPGVRGVLPKKTHYARHVADLAEACMGTIIVKPLLAFFDRLRWIQHGDIHLYIGYILATIIVLLFFV